MEEKLIFRHGLGTLHHAFIEKDDRGVYNIKRLEKEIRSVLIRTGVYDKEK